MCQLLVGKVVIGQGWTVNCKRVFPRVVVYFGVLLFLLSVVKVFDCTCFAI